MRTRSIVSIAVILISGVVLRAPRVEAQTRFVWPDTAAKLSAYSIEECRVMLWRIKRDLAFRRLLHSSVWWDTMPYPSWTSDTEPPISDGWGGTAGQETWDGPLLVSGIAATARRCGGTRFTGQAAPFSADSLPITAKRGTLPTLSRFFWQYDLFPMHLVLFRDAESYADIKAYLDRYLQASPPDSIAFRLAAALRTLGRKPRARYPLFEELVATYAPKVPDHVQRARFYAYTIPEAFEREQMHLDTVTMLRAATRLQRFVNDSLTAPERQAFLGHMNQSSSRFEDPLGELDGPFPRCIRCPGINEWMTALFQDIRLGIKPKMLSWGLDSLRQSTAAFFAFWRDSSQGGHLVSLPGANGKDSVHVWQTMAEHDEIGQKVRPIVATAWAGPKVSGPRPTPGRPSLLFFFSFEQCQFGAAVDRLDDFKGNCAPQFIHLRRLVEHFPSLEVTVVSRTHGYFRNVIDSMTPAREAELTAQMLASYGVTTVPVAMYDKPFIRLPDPDGRFMERAVDDSNAFLYTRRDLQQPEGLDRPGLPGLNGTFMGDAVIYGRAILNDENGIAIYEYDMRDRDRFDELEAFVKVLLERKHPAP